MRDRMATIDSMRERAEKAERERDAALAAIEGSTVPPTDAEIAAHAEAGGLWRMVADGPLRRMVGQGAPTYYEMVDGSALPALMRAYAEGSPRCWPTINGVIVARPVAKVAP
jgi:hypothetical protein